MIIRRFDVKVKSIRWRKITMRKDNCGGVDMTTRLQELKKTLQDNMNKAILIAEKNTIRNNKGQVVLSVDDEWRENNEWNRQYDN